MGPTRRCSMRLTQLRKTESGGVVKKAPEASEMSAVDAKRLVDQIRSMECGRVLKKVPEASELSAVVDLQRLPTVSSRGGPAPAISTGLDSDYESDLSVNEMASVAEQRDMYHSNINRLLQRLAKKHWKQADAKYDCMVFREQYYTNCVLWRSQFADQLKGLKYAPLRQLKLAQEHIQWRIDNPEHSCSLDIDIPI